MFLISLITLLSRVCEIVDCRLLTVDYLFGVIFFIKAALRDANGIFFVAADGSELKASGTDIVEGIKCNNLYPVRE